METLILYFAGSLFLTAVVAAEIVIIGTLAKLAYSLWKDD